MDSILNSIKDMLGIPLEDQAFDQELVFHINTVLDILYQLGLGFSPAKITGSDETWEEVLGQDTNLELVKSYIYMKVKLIFDPPQSSITMESMRGVISELEWRINVEVDK